MVKLPLKEKTKVVLTAAVRVAVDPAGAAVRVGLAPLTHVEVNGPAADVPQIAVVVSQLPEVRAGSQKRSWARSPGVARSASRNAAASRPAPGRFRSDMTPPGVNGAAEPDRPPHTGAIRRPAAGGRSATSHASGGAVARSRASRG